MKKTLSEEGKREIAFALLLLKDFKCNGRFDIEITKSILELSDYLGVREKLEELISKVPPFIVKPR